MSDQVSIHPTAVVDPTAQIGKGCVVGPSAVIEANVVLGEHCSIGPFSVVGSNSRLGAHNVIHHHAAVGTEPQDLTFHGEETYLAMGDHNRVREFVTINRGTSKADRFTRIGDHNLFMACCHVAHDCTIGNHVIMANNALLAGHVTVEDRAIINGAAGVQQFSTIGMLSYVGGLTRIVHDVPPFMVVEGNPSKVRKVNTVGLRRTGYSDEQIQSLKEAHRRLFRSRRPRSEVLSELEDTGGLSSEVRILCQFLRRMEGGHQGRSREA